MARTSTWGLALALAALAWVATAPAQAPEQGRPWARQYAGEDATGPDVIALWQFLPGQEAADNSGNNHGLTLRGESRFVPEGLFGSCLESFGPGEDLAQANGAVARHRPELSPPGAFALEAWFKAKPEFHEAGTAFLIDKKYFHYVSDRPGANNDYMLFLRRRGERHEVVAYLGFGEDSAFFVSEPITIETGEWAHVAFAYNGAGVGRTFFNGQLVGRAFHEGRGPVAPGRHPLVIGDRVGSNYVGFPGFIDQVRIVKGVPAWMAGVSVMASEGRTVFQRMEQGAAIAVTVDNDTEHTLRNAAVTVALAGLPPNEIRLGDIPPGRPGNVEAPVDTTLRPGEYEASIRLTGQAAGRPVAEETAQTITIVPRPLPKYMPVVMWGFGDVERLKEVGFTHDLASLADFARIWRAGEETDAQAPGTIERSMARLDERLAHGLASVATVSPARYMVTNEELQAQFGRVDWEGKPYERKNVCGLFPEVQEYCYNVGASMARTFGSHPAFDGTLIHTEIRDGTNLCFHEHDRAAYRAYSGEEFPPQARAKGGINYARLEGFPADRIVEDDHPVLRFYRWFWREGDGWNELHSRVHRGLKTATKPGFWTFFDPAVRCPPIWGSGGEVDFVSQWTYTYPDPPRIGLATDELFAMAAGRPGQQVMKMTQIIWYRSGTAPELPEREEDRVDWEREIPDARFITIAPDHLREALWLKLARPVQGIMYHGWGSLVGAAHRSYMLTNHETRGVLAELTRSVVQPLGPALMQVPDAPADVAIHESFAATVFGARGTWGWGAGWMADAHMMLQWARLQPKVVYDETILRDGLEGVRILVMPSAVALPRSVFERIQEFQARGGIVVGDQDLAPALTPDILLRSQPRQGEPHEAKAALQEMAANLREELAPVYHWRADSSSPDAIVRLRSYGETDYLFAINDRRTYGDYVGHHRRVMEKGLPLEATLFIRRQGAAVYDLMTRRRVETRPAAGGMEWTAQFGPGEGRVYMIAPRPVAGVRVEVPPRHPGDRRVVVRASVVDAAGRTLDAVVPVRLRVLDPRGEEAEFSGHYGAKDGAVEVALDLAPNDEAGTWTVNVVELASGQSARAQFQYRR